MINLNLNTLNYPKKFNSKNSNSKMDNNNSSSNNKLRKKDLKNLKHYMAI